MVIVEPPSGTQAELDRVALVVRLEYCGSICWKSEYKIDLGSAIPICSKESTTLLLKFLIT